jgi:hypothetical protein
MHGCKQGESVIIEIFGEKTSRATFEGDKWAEMIVEFFASFSTEYLREDSMYLNDSCHFIRHGFFFFAIKYAEIKISW